MNKYKSVSGGYQPVDGELGKPPTSGSAVTPGLYGPNGTLARFTASCARIHDLAERTRAVATKSKAGQAREAIREAMKGESLDVRILAYQFGDNASDESLERLWRLLR